MLTRTNRVFVKLNAGDGTFGILTPYDIDGHSIRDLSLVDFDGDGAIDVTAAETDSQHGGLLVPPGLGKGQLDSSALHVVDMGDGSNGGTMASDLNGDGHVSHEGLRSRRLRKPILEVGPAGTRGARR